MSHDPAIEQELKELLEQNNHSLDQDEILQQIDAPEEEILTALHNLMEKGKISYDIDWNIDGRGKTYTTGLTE